MSLSWREASLPFGKTQGEGVPELCLIGDGLEEEAEETET